jgi:hypothetical protein
MIPNPWVILGGVLTALALTVGGFLYGAHVTNTSRDAEALTAQLKATEQARAIEQGWQAKLDASQSQLAKERQDAQARESSLRADIDSGARQLRIAIARQQLPGNPEGSSGSNDETAELAPSARSAYSNLRTAIIETEQSLNACQGYVRAIGGNP